MTAVRAQGCFSTAMVLKAHRDGEYVLWFEADLYDQLQILQILARLDDLGAAQRSAFR